MRSSLVTMLFKTYCTVFLFSVYVLACIDAADGNLKVCPTLGAYFLPSKEKGCHLISKSALEFPEVVTQWGYKLIRYQVTTEDGYILEVFRIPANENSDVVLLAHGIYMNPLGFISRGQLKSLALVLRQHNKDVWMVSFRGTMYSRGHVKYKDTELAYWNYTINEYAVFDIQAVVRKMRETVSRKIYFIGFSMGTSAGIAYNCEKPEEAAQNFAKFIYLAPVAIFNPQSPIILFAARMFSLFKLLLYSPAFHGELLRPNTKASKVFRAFATANIVTEAFVNFLKMLIFGFNFKQIDWETLPIVEMTNFDSICVKVLEHYVQLIRKGDEFRKFDFGPENNLKVYGRATAPKYDVNKIQCEQIFIVGRNDPLARLEDVEKLNKRLPPHVRSDIRIIKDDKFSHSNFIDAKDVLELVYKDLIKDIS